MTRTKMGRREFIASAAKSFGAIGIGSIVAESLMGHLLNRAFAAGAVEGFYIHLSLPGGPPRWYFDQALNPSGAAGDFVAGGFGNRIVAGADGLARTVHATHRYSAGNEVFQLPPVWGMPRSGDSADELLRHMQMFRGVDMQINNHTISNQRQTAPVIGGASIGGSLADASGRAIASVVVGGTPAGAVFRTEKALAPVNATVNNGAANPLTALLRPFRPLGNTSLNDPRWEQAIGASLQEFETYLGNIGARPNVMHEAYDQAIDLIKTDKYKIADKWAAIYPKYKQAVDEATARATIDRLFTAPIKADGTKPFRIDSVSGRDVNLSAADLRTMFNAGVVFPNMADVFALTEIVVLEKLSSNLIVPLQTPQNFSVAGKVFGITHDQHFIGTVVSALSTTAYYRGVINCLQELVRSLKAGGAFNNTVIHIGSEFSRTPRPDGSGSDHGFQGSSASVISGKINAFSVIGNVKKGGDATYTGTWGLAADFQNGRPIWVQDIANTICTMLSVKPVSENGVVLLNSANGWKPFKAEAKNVA